MYIERKKKKTGKMKFLEKKTMKDNANQYFFNVK